MWSCRNGGELIDQSCFDVSDVLWRVQRSSTKQLVSDISKHSIGALTSGAENGG